MPNPILQSIEVANACRSLEGIRQGHYLSQNNEQGDNVIVFPSMDLKESDLVAKIQFRDCHPKDPIEPSPLYFSQSFPEEDIVAPKVCEITLIGHFSAMHIVSYDNKGTSTLSLRDFLFRYANRRLNQRWLWKPVAMYSLEAEIMDASQYSKGVLDGQLSMLIKPRLVQGRDVQVQVLYPLSEKKPRLLLVSNIYTNVYN